MIVIPMAGESSRFKIKGYTQPKFMLPLWSGYVFDYVLKGFECWYDKEHFLFICRDSQSHIDFIRERIKYLGVDSFTIVALNEPTKGQADTVYQGISRLPGVLSESLYIYNIDTIRSTIEPLNSIFANFKESDIDGYLETIQSEGSNWSNVIVDPTSPVRVLRTSEKMNEPPFCSTGLYYFRNASLFRSAFEDGVDKQKGEIYIAPLYNYLISNGSTILNNCISSKLIKFCGVPSEYEALRKIPY